MGTMELQDIARTLKLSLKIRDELTDSLAQKLDALANHLSTNQYCLYLQERGELDNCDSPSSKADPSTPPAPPSPPQIKLLYQDPSP